MCEGMPWARPWHFILDATSEKFRGRVCHCLHASPRWSLSSLQWGWFQPHLLTAFAPLLHVKTHQHRFLLLAIAFELCLLVLLVYVPPFNTVFGTAFLGMEWLMGLPWALLLLGYDEARKACMRRDADGLLRRTTYW